MSDTPNTPRDDDPLSIIRTWLEDDPFDGPPPQLEPLVTDRLQREPP